MVSAFSHVNCVPVDYTDHPQFCRNEKKHLSFPSKIDTEDNSLEFTTTEYGTSVEK